MGCIARLGCLFILACAAVVGWFTRDRWMPERFRSHPSAVSAKAPGWDPLTQAGADRTRAALAKLSQPRGPVFQTLSGADVASYAFRELAKQLPASTDSIETMVQGESLSMRASVKLSDLGGAAALGALGGMLGDRERVQFTGTLRVVHPGMGEFQMQDVKVRGLTIPRGMIHTLIGRLDRGTRPVGVDTDALPLPLPSYIGDIRVANGKVTLYKNVQ
jgi:hypothetical protein